MEEKQELTRKYLYLCSDENIKDNVKRTFHGIISYEIKEGEMQKFLLLRIT